MCLLQDTFLWAEKLNDSDRKQLPIGAREELLSCALLLPLCHANIRWSVSCRIGATNASSTHGGPGCSFSHTQHSSDVVPLRRAQRRACPSRLGQGPAAAQRNATGPKELEEPLLSLPWNQTETCSFAHKQHKNIQEARMIQRELKDLVSESVQPLKCSVS